MARIGKSVAAVKKHLQAAQQGATFLLVYAPNDDGAEGVMSAVGDKPVTRAPAVPRQPRLGSAVGNLGEYLSLMPPSEE